MKDAAAVVEPDPVRVAASVGDEGVQVTVAVQIAQAHVMATVIPQALAAIGEVATAVVPPHPVGFTIISDEIIGDEGVEVAVAVQIAQRHGSCWCHRPQRLAAVGKGAPAVVQPDPVRAPTGLATKASRSPSPSKSPA